MCESRFERNCSSDSVGSMPRKLHLEAQSWPINGSFTISRGSRTQAQVLQCTIEEEGASGRGECVPYKRYGESLESVTAQIESVQSAVEAGASRLELLTLLPPGAARNAVDCALWDLEAKQSGLAVWQSVCSQPPVPVLTAVTVSLGTPQEMAKAIKDKGSHPLIKVKLGGEGDAQRIVAVCQAAPHARIILDANEAWTEKDLPRLMEVSARHGVALIEQPLHADNDHALCGLERIVPVCADESAHTAENVHLLLDRYDAVNIKLDKTGGLTAGMAMKHQALRLGFGIMAGCMVGTSLAMAPAVLLAQGVDWSDLDGPLILAGDRENGLSYADGMVSPPRSILWG